MGRVLAAAAACLVLLTACPRPSGMCSMNALRGEALSPKAETWSELLLYGHSRRLQTIMRPPLDCTGVPVTWQEPRASECAEPGPSAEPIPAPVKLPTEDDVTVKLAGPGLQLVWLRTQAFTNGEFEGPIALVSTEDDALIVQAVGTLRSLPVTRLSLEAVGANQLLVAEGELCTKTEPPSCQSTTRLLLLHAGRFVAVPVVSREGKCIGPNWFPRHREQTYALANGMRRKIEQTSSVEVKDDRILVNESIDVRDVDPKSQSAPPEPFHTTRAKRILLVQQARLMSDAPSPWPAVIEKFASGNILAEVPPAAPRAPAAANAASTAASKPEAAPATAAPATAAPAKDAAPKATPPKQPRDKAAPKSPALPSPPSTALGNTVAG